MIGQPYNEVVMIGSLVAFGQPARLDSRMAAWKESLSIPGLGYMAGGLGYRPRPICSGSSSTFDPFRAWLRNPRCRCQHEIAVSMRPARGTLQPVTIPKLRP